jgi:hypothetical protein
LTSPVAGTATPLYQILGFAVDYRARRVLLRFEWIDNDGVPLARGPDRWLRLDPTFADYVRETLADPAFGVGPHAAGR